MEFDRVEWMPLDTFRKLELSKLKKEDTENTLHVIRNTAENECSLLLGDGVIKYKLTGMSEVYLGDVLEELKTPEAEESVVTTGLPWPLICRVKKGSNIFITVLIRSEKRYYNSYAGGESYSIPYYPPDLWFNMSMSLSGVVRNGRVCVVKEFKPAYTDTELFRWPLANVYDTGSICYGGANMTVATSKRDEASKIREALSLFIDAQFNCDLVMSRDQLERMHTEVNVTGAYTEEPYAHLIARCGSGYTGVTQAELIKLLYAMKEPNGWRNLRFCNLANNPEGFCNV